MNKIYIAAVSAFAVLVTVVSAQAQILTAGTVTGDASVDNVGTSALAAFLTGADSNATETVNGVTFTKTASNNPSVALTQGNILFTGTDEPGGAAANGAPNGLSTALTNVLAVVGYNNQASATCTLSLSGLTPGDRYQFQVFGGSQGVTGFETATDGTASATLTINGATSAGYVIDSFTAGSGGAETVTLTATAASDGNVALFNAVDLQDVTSTVPEPSCAAAFLMGCALFRTVLYFRRRSALV